MLDKYSVCHRIKFFQADLYAQNILEDHCGKVVFKLLLEFIVAWLKAPN